MIVSFLNPVRSGRERSSSVVANEAQILAHVHTAFQALLDTFVASAGRDMSDVFRISVQAKVGRAKSRKNGGQGGETTAPVVVSPAGCTA